MYCVSTSPLAPSGGDRDEIEGRMSAGHCDARDSHGIQEIKALISVPFVVVLKGRYSLCDDLCLSIDLVDADFILNKNQEDVG